MFKIQTSMHSGPKLLPSIVFNMFVDVCIHTLIIFPYALVVSRRCCLSIATYLLIKHHMVPPTGSLLKGTMSRPRSKWLPHHWMVGVFWIINRICSCLWQNPYQLSGISIHTCAYIYIYIQIYGKTNHYI